MFSGRRWWRVRLRLRPGLRPRPRPRPSRRRSDRMPTDADFKERARVLVEHMATVGRIVYATPIAFPRDQFEAALRDAGLTLREVDAEAEADVSRWTDEPGDD